MRIPIILLLLLSYALESRSQSITLSLGTLPSGVWRIEFVDRITVLNPGSAVTCRIDLDILSTNGENVAHVGVGDVRVVPGFSMLSSLTHARAVVTYGNLDAGRQLQATGMLPSGRYVMNAVLTEALTGRALASASTEMPLVLTQAPLRLIYPSDGDTIYSLEPVLRWIGPQPTPVDVRYTLLVFDTKSKGKRKVPLSLPLRKVTDLHQEFFPYVAQIPGLTFGNTYAWKVVASASGYTIGESDTWQFTPGKKSDKKTRSPEELPDSVTHEMPYWVLNDQLDGGFYDAYGVCKLSFVNRGPDSLLTYNLVDLQQPDIFIEGTPTVSIRPGLNYVTIPLQNIAAMEPGRFYLLNVRMSNLTEYRIRFKYADAR